MRGGGGPSAPPDPSAAEFAALSNRSKARRLFEVAIEGCVQDRRGRFDTSAVRVAMCAAGARFGFTERDNPVPFARANVHMRLQDYYKKPAAPAPKGSAKSAKRPRA